jgi:hypothetical protein
MPIRFACPNCQRVLRVDDNFAGKRAKCPGCANPVTVPAASDGGGGFNFTAKPGAPAAAGGQWDDAGATGGGGALEPGWLGVRGGLKLLRLAMTIRLCTMVAVMIVGGVLVATSAALVFQTVNQLANRQARAAQPGPEFPEPIDPINPANPANPGISDGTAGAVGVGMLVGLGCFALIIGGLLFACFVLEVVGYARWLSVPASAGGYGLAMTTLLCTLAPIVIGVLSAGSGVALPPDVGELVGRLLGLANMAAGLTAFICGLLFIRNIGVALDDSPTRSAVLSYVIWIAVFIVVLVLSFCVLIAGAMAMGAMAFNSQGSGNSAAGFGVVGIAAGATVGLINFILWIMVIVKYYGMLNAGIRAIDTRAATA